MTVLARLNDLYLRMNAAGDAPDFGFSMEYVAFKLEIGMDGDFLRMTDIRSLKSGKPTPVRQQVPAVQRTSNINARLGCDRIDYLLGVGSKEDKGPDGKKVTVPAFEGRTSDYHRDFVSKHRDLIGETDDPHLTSFLEFLDTWSPEDFVELGLPHDALDQTTLVQVGEGENAVILHDHPVIRAAAQQSEGGEDVRCLVTGEVAPVARTHPSIKGVRGGQPSGTAIVSFNNSSFRSHGKTQGANAPVSEDAAFGYVTALNALLGERDIGRRNLSFGDATVVFWAEAPDADMSQEGDWIMSVAMDPPKDADEVAKVRSTLSGLAHGKPSVVSGLDPETKIFLLGVAPNAGRLSIRFWHPGEFGDFAKNVMKFWDEMALETDVWDGAPSIKKILAQTTKPNNDGIRKADEARPGLGEQIMKSVLTGQKLPNALMANVLERIHKERNVSGKQAAICKAIVNQSTRKEKLPVGIDNESQDPAYLLGRLFALLEKVQTTAMPNVGVTVRDKYFSAAAATPARVFPLIEKNLSHQLSLIKRSGKEGLAIWFDAQIAEVKNGLGVQMPRTFALEDQGRFSTGYYHQKSYRKPQDQKETTQDA